MWSDLCLGEDISQGDENEQADRYGLLLVLWIWDPGQRAETPTFWSILSDSALDFAKKLQWLSVLTRFSKAVES